MSDGATTGKFLYSSQVEQTTAWLMSSYNPQAAIDQLETSRTCSNNNVDIKLT